MTHLTNKRENLSLIPRTHVKKARCGGECYAPGTGPHGSLRLAGQSYLLNKFQASETLSLKPR